MNDKISETELFSWEKSIKNINWSFLFENCALVYSGGFIWVKRVCESEFYQIFLEQSSL